MSSQLHAAANVWYGWIHLWRVAGLRYHGTCALQFPELVERGQRYERIPRRDRVVIRAHSVPCRGIVKGVGEDGSIADEVAEQLDALVSALMTTVVGVCHDI